MVVVHPAHLPEWLAWAKRSEWNTAMDHIINQELRKFGVLCDELPTGNSQALWFWDEGVTPHWSKSVWDYVKSMPDAAPPLLRHEELHKKFSKTFTEAALGNPQELIHCDEYNEHPQAGASVVDTQRAYFDNTKSKENTADYLEALTDAMVADHISDDAFLDGVREIIEGLREEEW